MYFFLSMVLFWLFIMTQIQITALVGTEGLLIGSHDELNATRKRVNDSVMWIRSLHNNAFT